MVLLKFEGVKTSVFPSNSSETTSAIFNCSGAHMPAFLVTWHFPAFFFQGTVSQTWKRGDIITEYRMQNKEYEWRNDRDQNRTRNRGNIIPECKIKNDSTEATHFTDAEYNIQTIWNWLDERVNYQQGIIKLKKLNCRNIQKKIGNL